MNTNTPFAADSLQPDLEKVRSWLAHLVLPVLLLMVLSASFNIASALEFECEVPGDKRFLRVEIPGDGRLCEVSVTYQYTDERRVMWYAENDSLFCSARAYELKEKYESEWGFTCDRWPDLDGIDYLSESQRRILDQRLFALTRTPGTNSPQGSIRAVKAVASTPLNETAGLMAIQYFLESGDRTEIIEDDGERWQIISTIDNIASYVVEEAPVSLAIIESIADNGALSINTRLSASGQEPCKGRQTFLTLGNSPITPFTDHRFVCNDIAGGQ